MVRDGLEGWSGTEPGFAGCLGAGAKAAHPVWGAHLSFVRRDTRRGEAPEGATSAATRSCHRLTEWQSSAVEASWLQLQHCTNE